MRLPPDLPPDLKSALDGLAHGTSRRALAERAAAQSLNYRAGGTSRTVATREDALAYAFSRLPATYAAVTAMLDAMRAVCPDAVPQTLLDIGAGPGTAAFAATQAFASITEIRLIDANVALRQLALDLMAQAHHAALRHADYLPGDALRLLAGAAPADLVIASYVAGEIADGDVPRFAAALWAATGETLAVIEPGTPAGHARIMRMRSALLSAGATVAAPCPHDQACPLPAPDWCHFAQRLPRSRDHLQVKGADVPFEDEKFSYVVMTRTTPHRATARVLAPPAITKIAATSKLCTTDGIVVDVVERRQAEAYRRRKAWRWGDGVDR